MNAQPDASGTIRVLPPIAAAVGDQVEVVLDGGIRRGGDVVIPPGFTRTLGAGQAAGRRRAA